MSFPENILITAASGNIGSHLVPLLLSQTPRPKLILPTSNARRLTSSLPSGFGVEGRTVIPEGSIKDPVWLETLLRENTVDTIFLCLTGTDEMFTALTSLDAISRVPTVKRLVYISIIGDFTSETGFSNTVRTRAYPHLFAKILVEHKLIHGSFDFEWAVLGPTVFFTNDYMQKSNLMEKGELSALSQHGINRIAPSDIALAARNVMYNIEGTWNRKKVQLGTKKLYNAAELVRIWSEALDKPIKAIYVTPEGAEAFEQHLRTAMPDDAGKGFARSLRMVYESQQVNGISMTEAEYQEQVKLLGKEPEALEPWVQETARAWMGE